VGLVSETATEAPASDGWGGGDNGWAEPEDAGQGDDAGTNDPVEDAEVEEPVEDVPDEDVSVDDDPESEPEKNDEVEGSGWTDGKGQEVERRPISDNPWGWDRPAEPEADKRPPEREDHTKLPPSEPGGASGKGAAKTKNSRNPAKLLKPPGGKATGGRGGGGGGRSLINITVNTPGSHVNVNRTKNTTVGGVVTGQGKGTRKGSSSLRARGSR
jgi:hypothetical protein